MERVEAGDQRALEELMGRHRAMVRRFVQARLDAGLRARVDASDVVQETQLEVARRMRDYLRRRPMEFQVWLRKTAYENLIRLRRRHLGAERRAAGKELPLPDRSSLLLAKHVFGQDAPEQRLLGEELAECVRQALAQLDDLDREVLLLRTVDGLKNQEVAQVLSVEPGTASKRYGRALLRLRSLLLEHGVTEGGMTEGD
jgi:RNA polymerase sigma-70 factor (ECF subfamily)